MSHFSKSSHKSNKIRHKKLTNFFCMGAGTVQFQHLPPVPNSSSPRFIPFRIYSLGLLISLHHGYNGKPQTPAFSDSLGYQGKQTLMQQSHQSFPKGMTRRVDTIHINGGKLRNQGLRMAQEKAFNPHNQCVMKNTRTSIQR